MPPSIHTELVNLSPETRTISKSSSNTPAADGQGKPALRSLRRPLGRKLGRPPGTRTPDMVAVRLGWFVGCERGLAGVGAGS